MQYLGDFKYGATVYVPFATYGASGESITLTGLAVTDIEIYKNGNTTQRASDNGYTLLDTDGIDLDGITGVHGFSIDTSDNSTAGFFGPGNDYFVIVSTVTINSQTVTFGVHFSIENRGGDKVLARTTIATLTNQTSFTLTAGAADNDAYNDCVIVIQDQASAVQKCVGVIDDYTGSTRTVALRTDPAVFTMATGDYVTILADRALKPTVMNRTLDVSAGGESGVDWSNIGSPSTTVNLSGTSTLALEPTTAGRKLDVTTGGEAGLDWGNIGSPGTTQNLSATTFSTTQVVATATALGAQAKADVNAEVLDVVNVDTIAEMGAGAPPASPTMRQMLNYVYRWLIRNKKTVDSSSSPTVETVLADDGTTPLFKRDITDSGNTTTFDETVSG